MRQHYKTIKAFSIQVMLLNVWYRQISTKLEQNNDFTVKHRPYRCMSKTHVIVFCVIVIYVYAFKNDTRNTI